MTKHLEIMHSGDLYDTRGPLWSKAPPLRTGYHYHYHDIKTVAQLKATVRAGPYMWPGGYPLYFVCSDGEALCFACVRKEWGTVLGSMAPLHDSGWRVVGCQPNYEDTELQCVHCNAPINA